MMKLPVSLVFLEANKWLSESPAATIFWLDIEKRSCEILLMIDTFVRNEVA